MSSSNRFQEISTENTKENIIFDEQQIDRFHKQETLIHELQVENQKLNTVIFHFK